MAAKPNFIIDFFKGLSRPRGQKALPPEGERAQRKYDPWEQLERFIGAVPRVDPVTDGQNAKWGVNFQYTYGEYDEMLERDPMIGATLMQRFSAVLNRDRVIRAATDDPQAKKAKALVEAIINRFDRNSMDGGFTKDLHDMMLGVPKGIAVMEIVWGWDTFTLYDEDQKPIEKGRYFVPLRLVARDPRVFGFDKDSNLRLLTSDNMDGTLQHPMKYIVFRPYNRYEDPYGTPLLRSLFWLYWFKKTLTLWWVKRAERIGDPTAYALPKDKDHSWSDDQETAVKNALDSIQQTTAFTLPAGTTAGFLEAPTNSEFETIIKWIDDQESMRIIGQTMTTDTGEKGGSKGLSEVHERVAHTIQAMDARALESINNSTWIQWAVGINLGDVPMPQLEIVTEPPKNLVELAELIEKAIQWDGYDVSIKGVEEMLGIPRAKTPAEALKPRVDPMKMLGPGGNPQGQPSQSRRNKTKQKRTERRRQQPAENEPRPRPSKP